MTDSVDNHPPAEKNRHLQRIMVLFGLGCIAYFLKYLSIEWGGNVTPVDDWCYSVSVNIKSWFLYEYFFLAGFSYLAMVVFFWIFNSFRRLVELMIVIIIIGFLGAIAVPNFRKARMGMSVGGAKNVDAFRLNIQRGKLPLASTITFEGLFYDYYFYTGDREAEPEWLFSPTYAAARCFNPISGKSETFMSVGLNSNLDEAEFARKRLNLVIVLDISGSMSGGFANYYYDQFRNNEEQDEFAGFDKMRVANHSIVRILDHLKPDDRLGIVLFDHNAYLAKPLRLLKQTDMAALKKHILEITPRGSTNMEAGLEMGKGLFESIDDYNPEVFENRIIFLTDAMPNSGRTDSGSLLGITRTMAQKGIYTSFIGVGIDFNTDLVEEITKVRGANYFSVNSSWEFKKRLDKEFKYMVTPLVFDLELNLKSEGYQIERVMGSPEANISTGELMKVNTLFPSPSEEGLTKGGIILLEMAETGNSRDIVLEVRYKDRSGKQYAHEKKITFDPPPADYFEHTGIRKAVALANYIRFMHQWIKSQSSGEQQQDRYYGWEHSSTDFNITDVQKSDFIRLRDYLEREIKEVEDESMRKEIEIINQIIGKKSS